MRIFLDESCSNFYNLFSNPKDIIQRYQLKLTAVLKCQLWRGVYVIARPLCLPVAGATIRSSPNRFSHIQSLATSSKINQKPSCFEECLTRLLNCPKYKELYDAVWAEGPFDIRLVKPKEAPLGFAIDLPDRAIFINESAPDWEHLILLALMNLKQESDNARLQTAQKANKISTDWQNYKEKLRVANYP